MRTTLELLTRLLSLIKVENPTQQYDGDGEESIIFEGICFYGLCGLIRYAKGAYFNDEEVKLLLDFIRPYLNMHGDNWLAPFGLLAPRIEFLEDRIKILSDENNQRSV